MTDSGSLSTEPDCYLQIRAEIISGVLMPNQHLVEAELAAKFGVGRGAVRTALARLCQDGLIVQEPYRGARVRVVNESEAVEILQARAVLEGLCARNAALRATDDEIADIQKVFLRMLSRLDKGDLLGYSDDNSLLHSRILAASRHATAQQLLQMLKAQVVRFQYRELLVPGRLEVSRQEHALIVETIVARNADAADTAMCNHIYSVIENVIKVYDHAMTSSGTI